MTITTLPTRNEYTATAGQTVFTYTFKIFESSDLNVYQTPAGAVSNDITDLITGYTVTGVGDEDGGTITLTTPANSGDLITIVSDIPESRTTDYQNNGDFRPDVVNDDFDRVVSLVKQINDNESRTLSFQESQQGASGLSLPIPSAGLLLRWNGAEDGLENVDFATPVETSVAGVTALRNLSESDTYADGTIVNVLGYYSNGDGGGDQFYWDSTSIETDNSVTIIKVTTVTLGRWKRLLDDTITLIKGGSDLPAVVSFVDDGSAIKLTSDYDVGVSGIISTEKTLHIYGEQNGEDSTNNQVGATIINDGGDTVDSPVIIFTSSSGVSERAKIRTINISSDAPTAYAVRFSDAIETIMSDVFIDLNSTGYGGVIYDDSGYFSLMDKVKIKSFNGVGVKITGVGSEHVLRDCHITSVSANTIGVQTDRNGLHIERGEYSLSGSGSIAIYLLTTEAAGAYGGTLKDIFFESIPSDGYGIVVDGTNSASSSDSFKSVLIESFRADLSSNQGTCVKFENASYCRVVDPQINRFSSGGTLVNWGELSVQCELVCDYIAALAPIIVHPSATRATKKVTGVIRRAEVSAITIASNLTTILVDGVDDLPANFLPVHNGTAWNYHMANITGNTAISITPPTETGIIRVINDRLGSSQGHIVYDADSVTAVCEVAGVGTDLEATTGTLNGTTGTASKVTVSAHTDGLIYVENRRSSANFTILFESNEF